MKTLIKLLISAAFIILALSPCFNSNKIKSKSGQFFLSATDISLQENGILDAGNIRAVDLKEYLFFQKIDRRNNKIYIDWRNNKNEANLWREIPQARFKLLSNSLLQVIIPKDKTGTNKEETLTITLAFLQNINGKFALNVIKKNNTHNESFVRGQNIGIRTSGNKIFLQAAKTQTQTIDLDTVIGNRDGQLLWNDGGFSSTCRDCKLLNENVLLRCTCKNLRNQDIQSDLDISRIYFTNGNLTRVIPNTPAKREEDTSQLNEEQAKTQTNSEDQAKTQTNPEDQANPKPPKI